MDNYIVAKHINIIPEEFDLDKEYEQMLKNKDLGIFGLSLQKSTDFEEFETVAH